MGEINFDGLPFDKPSPAQIAGMQAVFEQFTTEFKYEFTADQQHVMIKTVAGAAYDTIVEAMVESVKEIAAGVDPMTLCAKLWLENIRVLQATLFCVMQLEAGLFDDSTPTEEENARMASFVDKAMGYLLNVRSQ